MEAESVVEENGVLFDYSNFVSSLVGSKEGRTSQSLLYPLALT